MRGGLVPYEQTYRCAGAFGLAAACLDQRFLEECVVEEQARRMLVVNATEFVCGALGVAERVPVELGDVKASLGVPVSLVAAEERGVLALREHAFERPDGGARVAEPLLTARGAGERVVPERAVGVGVSLGSREVTAQGERVIAMPFVARGAFVGGRFVELGGCEPGAQRFAARK